MNICTKLRQLMNSAKLSGYTSIQLDSTEVKYTELQELKDCGYNVSEARDSEDGKYYVISE